MPERRFRALKLRALEYRADGRYGGPAVMWPKLPEGAVIVGAYWAWDLFTDETPNPADPGHWILEVEVPDPNGPLVHMELEDEVRLDIPGANCTEIKHG